MASLPGRLAISEMLTATPGRREFLRSLDAAIAPSGGGIFYVERSVEPTSGVYPVLVPGDVFTDTVLLYGLTARVDKNLYHVTLDVPRDTRPEFDVGSLLVARADALRPPVAPVVAPSERPPLRWILIAIPEGAGAINERAATAVRRGTPDSITRAAWEYTALGSSFDSIYSAGYDRLDRALNELGNSRLRDSEYNDAIFPVGHDWMYENARAGLVTQYVLSTYSARATAPGLPFRQPGYLTLGPVCVLKAFPNTELWGAWIRAESRPKFAAALAEMLKTAQASAEAYEEVRRGEHNDHAEARFSATEFRFAALRDSIDRGSAPPREGPMYEMGTEEERVLRAGNLCKTINIQTSAHYEALVRQRRELLNRALAVRRQAREARSCKVEHVPEALLAALQQACDDGLILAAAFDGSQLTVRTGPLRFGLTAGAIREIFEVHESIAQRSGRRVYTGEPGWYEMPPALIRINVVDPSRVYAYHAATDRLWNFDPDGGRYPNPHVQGSGELCIGHGVAEHDESMPAMRDQFYADPIRYIRDVILRLTSTNYARGYTPIYALGTRVAGIDGTPITPEGDGPTEEESEFGPLVDVEELDENDGERDEEYEND